MSAILTENELAHSCGHCRKPGCDLKCSKCKVVFFCNRDCQVANWKLLKKVCGVAKDIKNRVGFVDNLDDGSKIAFSEESLNNSALDHQRRAAERQQIEEAGGTTERDNFKMVKVPVHPEKDETRVYTKVDLKSGTTVPVTCNDLNYLSAGRDALLPVWSEILDPEIPNEEAITRWKNFFAQSTKAANIKPVPPSMLTC